MDDISKFTLKLVEKAVDYLQESEEEYARLKASITSEKKFLEVTLASLSMDSPENSAAKSKLWAESHQDYVKAVETYHNVLESYYLLDAKRHRAEQTIDIWRSVNSARNRGNV